MDLQDELDSLEPAVQELLLAWLRAERLTREEYARFQELHGRVSPQLYRKLDQELKKRL